MAEETNNEETYPFITSGRFLTAEEARQMYQPEYTLEEILDDVRRLARATRVSRHYSPGRMPKPLIRKLRDLGYTVKIGLHDNYEVSW